MNLIKKVALIGLLIIGVFNFGISEENEILKNANGLIKVQDFRKAEKLLNPYLKENPKSHEAMYYMAQIKLSENNYDDAIELMEKAVALDGKNSEYFVLLGGAYGTKVQNVSIFKQAFVAPKIKKSFEKAVELDGNNLNARFSLMQYCLFAPGIAGGGADKARVQADAIYKIKKVEGCSAYAMIYTKEEKFDKALEQYIKATELEPENMDLRLNLGYFYINQKNYEEAYNVVKNIFIKDPENKSAMYQIGKIGAVSGKYLDEAEKYLKTYMQTTPDSKLPSIAWANYRLGMVYENMKKPENAKECYKLALKEDGEFKEVKEALKKLK